MRLENIYESMHIGDMNLWLQMQVQICYCTGVKETVWEIRRQGASKLIILTISEYRIVEIENVFSVTERMNIYLLMIWATISIKFRDVNNIIMIVIFHFRVRGYLGVY